MDSVKAMRILLVSALLTLAGCAGAKAPGEKPAVPAKPATPPAAEQPARATIIVHVDSPKGKISKYIYGQFSEMLGRGVHEGIWVGEDSNIPNTRGIRNDVVAALKQMQVPVIRWPGGCFADYYHWKDGVGPRDKRRPQVNALWGGAMEDNQFGTHEFMDLCQQVGCEAYISANVGSGTVQEMNDWIAYLNSDDDIPMVRMRRANGRQDSWHVRFFGIGNESWGCGGNMTADYYTDRYLQFMTYAWAYSGNFLYRIASGPNVDNYAWTETLMRRAAWAMDGLSLHYYTVPGPWDRKGSAIRFDDREWFVTMQKALYMDELLKQHGAIMLKYDPDKRVGLIVDEWGTWYDQEPGSQPGFLYQQNTLRDAMVAAMTLNVFQRHCDRVKMANIAQTINVLQSMILTDKEKMVLTPTYHVFDMYKVHQDAIRLATDADAPRYFSGSQSIPGVSVSSSRDATGKVHISLCNPHPDRALPTTCYLDAMRAKAVTATILTAPTINAYNSFAEPDAVKPAGFSDVKLTDDSTVELVLPAKAIVVLEIEPAASRTDK
jgi:alpha-L-arabinofuranosidase